MKLKLKMSTTLRIFNSRKRLIVCTLYFEKETALMAFFVTLLDDLVQNPKVGFFGFYEKEFISETSAFLGLFRGNRRDGVSISISVFQRICFILT